MKIEFPQATPDQAEALSDLAIESKGHWGHSKDQLEVWRKDLRIDGGYIAAHLVRAILVNRELVGFFAVKKEKDGSLLDHLWLLSKAIGRGVGKRAFQKIVEDCHDLGIKEFTIVSDPNAEGFYHKQGAIRIGEVASIPQNRMLPKLRYRVKEPSHNHSTKPKDTKPKGSWDRNE